MTVLTSARIDTMRWWAPLPLALAALFLQLLNQWPIGQFYLQSPVIAAALLSLIMMPGSAGVFRPLTVLCAALTIAATCQFIFLDDGQIGYALLFWQAIIKWLMFGFAMLGISDVFSRCDRSGARRALNWFIGLCLVEAAAIIVIVAGRKPDLAFLGGFNNCNVWFMAFMLYAVCGLWFQPEGSRAHRRFLYVTLLTSGVFVTLTASREGVLGVLLLALLLFVKVRKRLGPREWRYVAIGAVAVIGIVGSTAGRWVDEIGSVTNFTVADQGGSSTLERAWIYVQWVQGLTFERVLTGQFDLCFRTLIPKPDESFCFLRNIHNGWLQIFATGGVLTFAALVWLIRRFYVLYLRDRVLGREFMIVYCVLGVISDYMTSPQLWMLLPAMVLLLPRKADLARGVQFG